MRLLFKNTITKIKKAIGRFLSMLFIIALGVGFFAGLREAAPSMRKTLDTYYDKYKLMDFKITSTAGITKSDIEALKKLDYIKEVIPTYSVDVLVDGKAVRVHAIESKVNNFKLIDGTMPKNNDECIAENGKYKVGDSITIQKSDINDYLNVTTYKVVATAETPLYLGKEKGIANIGNGKLESFMYVQKDNFKLEYYTEAYLIALGTEDTESYDESYEKTFKNLESELFELKPIRETIRYEEILEVATNEIIKIEDKLENETTEAEKKLNDAKKELDDNKRLLDDGKRKLDDAEATLNANITSTENMIASSRREINNGRQQWYSALNTYGLTEDSIDATLNTLSTTITNLETQLKELNEDSDEYIQILNNLSATKTQYNQLLVLKTTKATLDENELKLNQQESQFISQTNTARTNINNERAKLAENEIKINDGYKEYYVGVDELNSKIAEAEIEIQKAKNELNTIEKPLWYLLDRTDNNGYTSFKEDSSKIDAIATVFPIFFIIVVALMCLNTMTRMIEEERGEIGILEALGFSNFKISLQYLFYTLLATVVGIYLGLQVGYESIPKLCYSIYSTNYVLPELIVGVNPIPLSIIIISSTTLMAGVTIFACYKELRSVPAVLLRPKAPKNGKKVLIERINFIWSNLSFTWKVTARNLFRYKKRILMTTIGIAGCTGLLLIGFGIRDSVNGIVDLQYGGIVKYDATLILDEEIKTMSNDMIKLLKDNHIDDPALIKHESFTFTANDKKQDVYLIATSDRKELGKYISLKTEDGKIIDIPKYGAVITQKMAEILNVKIGDSIKIRNSDNELFILKVEDIAENYILHYIYMSSDYYKNVFGTDASYNAIIADTTTKNQDEIAENILKDNMVTAISFTKDIVKTFDTMIKGLNKVVYLLIFVACMLALIVLYNLTTININERVREIATLKVLGFHDNEVSRYVYHETIILTILGMIGGLFLGAILHKVVVLIAETDNLMFIKEINLISFVLSIIITLLFSSIVQIFTYFKLRQIDMIESLKSVE